MRADKTPQLLKSLNNYFDDLAIGDRYITPGRTVTEADIADFSKVSGDRNPLHTDKEFAARGPFGAIVAQGLCTLSFASGLEFAFYGEGERPTLAFYGMNNVRFTKPVFIGDTVHIEGEVTALDPKDETRGVVTYRQEIKNQHGETVVSLEKRSLLKARIYDELQGSSET